MLKLTILFFALSLIFSISHTQELHQTCSTYKFQHKTFQTCLNLPVLNSFIHWTFNDTSKIIDMAFRMSLKTEERWVAWGINPTSKGMVGSQTFIALRQADGLVKAYTSNIMNYGTKLQPSELSFKVYNVSAEATKDEMVIYAKFEIPGDGKNVDHVWQEGPVVNNNARIHELHENNVKSFGTMNFVSGKGVTDVTMVNNSRGKLKIIHGAINTISWGVMMPIGVIIARYVKVFPSADPMWFYLHISCQITAYCMGIIGGIIGHFLGKNSSGIQINSHKLTGSILFVLSSLQVLAMWLRPDKKHKYRGYWNIYHKTVGYVTIFLGVKNILAGFIIANALTLKSVYTKFFMILATIAVVLEVCTWCVVLKRKRKKPEGENQENNDTQPIRFN